MQTSENGTSSGRVEVDRLTPDHLQFLQLTRLQSHHLLCFHLSGHQWRRSEEVRRVMSSSDSSCHLDVIPTSLLKSCLDVLIKPTTIIVNLSLSEGSFPTTFTHALVKPLLEKHNLPQDELSSYRPISNLNFISKVLKRIIHARISSHLESFPSITPFQSAYRQFHSTETAFLRIQNDLLLAINKQKVSALVLHEFFMSSCI